MTSLLLRAALAAALAAAAADPALKPLFWKAYTQSHSSLLDANLLLASAQARLKRIEWAFRSGGKEDAVRGARESYDRLCAGIALFRPAAESASQAEGPSAPEERRLMDSAELRRKAAKIPDSTAEQINEILALRSRYEPAQSRKALQSSESLLAELERRLGKPEPLASHARALRLGEEAAAGVCAAHGRLSSSARESGSSAAQEVSKAKARAELKGLGMDCEGLVVELARLRIVFRLDRLYAENRPLF